MSKTKLSFYVPFEIVDEGEYNVSINGKSSSLRITSIPRCKEDFEKFLGGTYDFSEGGSVRILGDVWGVSVFSKIDIEISDYVHLEDGRIAAQKYLNRLIRVWRCHTRRHSIPYVSDDAILSFDWEVRDEEGKEKTGFIFGNYNKLHYPSHKRDSVDVLNNIHEYLEKEYTVPMYDVLRLSARNHYEKGQFNLAVIEMNISLESMVSDYLRLRMIKNGQDEVEIKKRMNKYLKPRSWLKKALHRAFLEEDKRSLKEEEPELWKKLDIVRNIRKNAIHPFLKELSKSETRDTLFTIEKIMQWITHRGVR